jgi:putative ATP-binding cassette transporter
MIRVNVNVNAFTAGYNYLIQLIPPLFVAPLFVRGDVEFGVITQAAMAFAALTGAFSLVVTQFPSLSSLGAVVTRLDSLVRGIDQARSTPASAIEFVDDETRLAYEALTLRSPTDSRVILNSLSISIRAGFHVLIRGGNTTGKIALFRATSGIWEAGTGRILRPPGFGIKFVPERPYLPPGTLRELLLRTGSESDVSDTWLLTVLGALDLEAVLKRAGGLDIERDWHDILALGEQQLLGFARVLLYKPRFVFLDRVTTALTAGPLGHVLRLLREHAITYITVGGVDDRLTDYDAILEIDIDGEWRLTPIGQEGLPKPHVAAAS